MKNKLFVRAAALSALFGMSACGILGGGKASAKLAMVNDTGVFQKKLERFDLSSHLNGAFAPRATQEAATVFQVRLIAAYITEDIDENQSNVGNTGMFYLNPLCEDDIMHCDISGGTAEDGAPMDKVITDFFDWGAASEDVNTALNASSKEIEPGSYRYVRLEFCKYNSGNADNFKFSWDGNATPVEFMANNCTVNGVEMDPPLEVAEGDSLT